MTQSGGLADGSRVPVFVLDNATNDRRFLLTNPRDAQDDPDFGSPVGFIDPRRTMLGVRLTLGR